MKTDVGGSLPLPLHGHLKPPRTSHGHLNVHVMLTIKLLLIFPLINVQSAVIFDVVFDFVFCFHPICLSMFCSFSSLYFQFYPNADAVVLLQIFIPRHNYMYLYRNLQFKEKISERIAIYCHVLLATPDRAALPAPHRRSGYTGPTRTLPPEKNSILLDFKRICPYAD